MMTLRQLLITTTLTLTTGLSAAMTGCMPTSNRLSTHNTNLQDTNDQNANQQPTDHEYTTQDSNRLLSHSGNPNQRPTATVQNTHVGELLIYAIRVSSAGGNISSADIQLNSIYQTPAVLQTRSLRDKEDDVLLKRAKQLIYLSRYGATIEERQEADDGYRTMLKEDLHPDLNALLQLQALQNRKILKLTAAATSQRVAQAATAHTNSGKKTLNAYNRDYLEIHRVKTKLHQVTEQLVDAKRIIKELADVEDAIREPLQTASK